MKSLTRAVIALAVLGSAPAQSLETVPATVSEMARHFRLDGVVEAVHQSTVAAQTSAQVEEVLFDIDDHVDKGEVIVVLRNTEQQAGVDQAWGPPPAGPPPRGAPPGPVGGGGGRVGPPQGV
ncbi:MAG: hypothetical protein OXN16_12285, partial [Gammaproteobacteria bacterium]|nr:hypothetical protein [Gammaproteobacteria bacterium]